MGGAASIRMMSLDPHRRRPPRQVRPRLLSRWLLTAPARHKNTDTIGSATSRRRPATTSGSLYSVAEAVAGSPSRCLRAACPACPTSRHRPTASAVPSFCSIGTILPSRPTHPTCRRTQRQSRMARLRATAPAARSVLDGREHDGILNRVGNPIPTHTKQSKSLQPRP